MKTTTEKTKLWSLTFERQNV